MGIVRWIKNALGQSGEDPTTETETSRKFPQQGNLNDNVNWLVRYDLERLMEGLERLTDKQFVIGYRSHDDYPEEGGPPRPVEYRPEHSRAGYLLFYIARESADHAHGPVVETDKSREATWIACLNATGLDARMELFDPALQDDVVRILNNAHISHVIRIVVHTVYPKRSGDSEVVKGITMFGQHVILPRPDPPTPYRDSA